MDSEGSSNSKDPEIGSGNNQPQPNKDEKNVNWLRKHAKSLALGGLLVTALVLMHLFCCQIQNQNHQKNQNASETSHPHPSNSLDKNNSSRVDQEDEHDNPSSQSGTVICSTDECNRIGNEILSSMNQNVKPCHDFYEFACGNWPKNNPLPNDTIRYNEFSKIRENITKFLEEIIQKPKSQWDTLPVQKAKDFYNSCLQLENDSMSELNFMLLEAYGGWPLILKDEWNETAFNWSFMAADMKRNYSSSDFFTLGIIQLAKTLPFQLHYSKPSFTLSAPYLANPSKYTSRVEAYKTFITSLIQEFSNHSLNRSYLTDKVDDMLKFEMKIAKLVQSPLSKNLNVLPKTFSLVDKNLNLTSEYEHLSIDAMFNRTFEGFPVNYTNTIIYMDYHYIWHLMILLKNTSTETLANYMHYRLLSLSINNLPWRFRKTYFDYKKSIYDVTETSTLARICFDKTEAFFGWGLASNYVEKFYPNSTRNTVEKLYRSIWLGFNRFVIQNEKMDDVFKEAFIGRAVNLTKCLGHPPWLFNASRIESYYANLSLDNYTTTFEKYRMLSRWTQAQWFSKLTPKVNPDCQFHLPQTVNAFYSARHQVEFPVAFLQPPVLDTYAPYWHQYSGAGYYMGHEIFHGFNVFGWTLDQTYSYNSRSKCFMDRMGDFQLSRLGVTNDTAYGRLTFGEVFADYGGLVTAFNAYKRATQLKQDFKIESLQNFSDDQLYFIAFAQNHCEIARKEGIEDLVVSDPHPPGKLRSHVALTNFPEFAQVWDCPVGSTMNPPKPKCSLF